MNNMIIAGIVVAIIVAAVALFATGIISLDGGSKYKSDEEVSDATVGIGSGVEKVGSILEEIDQGL